MNCADRFRERMRAIRAATRVEPEEVDGRPRCRWAACRQPLLGDGTCTRGHVQDDRLEYPGYPDEELTGLRCALRDLIRAEAWVGADPRVVEFQQLQDDWEALKVSPEEAYSRARMAMQGVVDVFVEQGGWEDDPRLQVAMVALNIALPSPSVQQRVEEALTAAIAHLNVLAQQQTLGLDERTDNVRQQLCEAASILTGEVVVGNLRRTEETRAAMRQAQAAQLSAGGRQQGATPIDLAAENVALRQALTEQETGAAALRAALEQVEWGSRNAAENTVCPWCGDQFDRWEDQSEHAPNCPRQLALAGNAGQAWLERLRAAEQALAQREALPPNAVVLAPESAQELGDLLVAAQSQLEAADALIPTMDTTDPEAACAPHWVPEKLLAALERWNRQVRHGAAVRQAQQLLVAPEVARAVRKARHVAVLTNTQGQTQVVGQRGNRVVHYRLTDQGTIEQEEDEPYKSPKAAATRLEHLGGHIVANGGFEHCPKCGEVYPVAGIHVCAEVDHDLRR